MADQTKNASCKSPNQNILNERAGLCKLPCVNVTYFCLQWVDAMLEKQACLWSLLPYCRKTNSMCCLACSLIMECSNISTIIRSWHGSILYAQQRQNQHITVFVCFYYSAQTEVQRLLCAFREIQGISTTLRMSALLLRIKQVHRNIHYDWIK